MKWTAYLDASVFWLLVIVLVSSFKADQKIVYQDGVLIEKITSQKYAPVMANVLQDRAGVRSIEVHELILDQEMKTGGCPYRRCMNEFEHNGLMESSFSGTLILLYY